MANTSNRGDQTGQAREHADAAKGHLQQAGSEARQAATTAASGLSQKAQETASNIGERARNLASDVSQRAGDVAERAENKADDALSSVGQRMSSMAGSLRQSAPREGMVGSAAGAVADRLDSGGRYLQEHGVSEITDDLAGVVRRNPLPALCLAFGVGFLIGMASRR
jgi:cell division septum initiation protein DivIVA